MVPYGAGKSTTANVILNNPEYKKVSGKVVFEGEDISNLSTDKIAKKGVFMSFQSPVEIPGISTTNFLKYAKNKITDKPVKIFELRDQIQKYMEELNMNPKNMERSLNVGFSGGEKKKNEIINAAMELLCNITYEYDVAMDCYNEFPIGVGFIPKNVDMDNPLDVFKRYSAEKDIEEIKMAKLEKDFASDKREEYYDMLGEIQAITSWIQELTKIETEKEIENVAKELCKMCYEIKNV